MPGAHPAWGRPIVCPETHATRNHPLTRDLRARKAKHSGMYMRARAGERAYTHVGTHMEEYIFTDSRIVKRTDSRAFGKFRRWGYQRKFCRSLDSIVRYDFSSDQRLRYGNVLIESNSWRQGLRIGGTLPLHYRSRCLIQNIEKHLCCKL